MNSVQRRRVAERIAQRLGILLGGVRILDVSDWNNGVLTFADSISRTEQVFTVSFPLELVGTGRRPTELDALAALLVERWLNMQAEIFLDAPTNRIGIRTPFNKDFVEEIKAFIPPAARAWKLETKTWYVNVTYLDSVQRIVAKFFPNVKNTTDGTAIGAVSDGDMYARLVNKLPDHALKAVYRAIVQACHPDRASANNMSVEDATEVLRHVNGVWAEIKIEKGW